MAGQVAQIPVGGAAAMVSSDAAVATGDTAPGIAVGINCTVAGNIKFRLADGSTIIIAVVVGFLQLNWRVTQLFTTGTTAVATIYNLRA